MATPDLDPVITAASSDTNDDNFVESKPNLSMVLIMQLVMVLASADGESSRRLLIDKKPVSTAPPCSVLMLCSLEVVCQSFRAKSFAGFLVKKF